MVQSFPYFQRLRWDPVELHSLPISHVQRRVQHDVCLHQILWRQQNRGGLTNWVKSRYHPSGNLPKILFYAKFFCISIMQTLQKNPTSCLLLNMLSSLSNSKLSRFYCLDNIEDSLLCFNLGRYAIIKLTQAKCFFVASSHLWWL